MSSSSSRKSARIFSQSRLLTPTLILWIRMMVGSGRKKRKEEKKRDRPYLLLDMGQGPYVVGSQKRRKAARKRPHRCYIHIHQIKSHISTRFFLVQMAPRFVEPTYGIPGYILVPIKPIPSSQFPARNRGWCTLFFTSSPSHQAYLRAQFSIHRTFTAEREQVSCHTSIDMCINNHAGNLTVFDTYTLSLSSCLIFAHGPIWGKDLSATCSSFSNTYFIELDVFNSLKQISKLSDTKKIFFFLHQPCRSRASPIEAKPTLSSSPFSHNYQNMDLLSPFPLPENQRGIFPQTLY